MATFENVFDEKVHPLIDRIDKVRSILPYNMKGITFPNVVVVGDQSSGKSTLLESLSLVELPKGIGIVTRCPLVLRLRNSNERRVYHLRDDNEKVLLDESHLNIMNYIEEETKKLAGDQKNVVNKLIELQVEDPNVRDLTVVDLPGIIRNPMADQPKNIHKQITDLIRDYISQDGCIILCVFAADSDIATAESFTLAREVDPEGVRTIGVITKSDLATNKDKLLQQLLMANVLQLKLGFIAVRCRSTDEKISLKDAREREKEFFDARFENVSATVRNCIGIGALINRLADLYSERIKDMFPKIQADIRKKWISTCDELSKFPVNLDTSDSRVAKYYQLIDIYVESVLKVRFSSSNDSMEDSLINSLHKEFLLFRDDIENHKKELLTSDFFSEVRIRMDTCFGKQLPNFLPHSVLQYFISQQIDKFWEAARILIKKCFLKATEFLPKNTDKDYNDDVLLKKLLPLFNKIAISFLREQKKEVQHKLLELVNLEKNDPYTMNHYYMDTISKFKNKCRQKLDADDVAMYDSMNEIISNDDQSVREMLTSIFVYWKVVMKRLMDYIAKYLRAGLVFNICPGVREALNRVSTEQSDLIHKYLTTDEYTLQQISKCQQNKDKFEKMYTILSGDHLEGQQGQVQYVDSDMNDSDIENDY